MIVDKCSTAWFTRWVKYPTIVISPLLLAACAAGNPSSAPPTFKAEREAYVTGSAEDRAQILANLRASAQHERDFNDALYRAGQTVHFDGVWMRWESRLRLTYIGFEHAIGQTYQMAVPMLVFPTDNEGNITGCGGRCEHAQPILAHVMSAATAEGENQRLLASILGPALQGSVAAHAQQGGGAGAAASGTGVAQTAIDIKIGTNPM